MVGTQWNSGATRDSNRGRRVLIPSALTTRPLSHTTSIKPSTNATTTTTTTTDLYPVVDVLLRVDVMIRKIGRQQRGEAVNTEFQSIVNVVLLG